jgi:preprotein translocase subunit SecA
MKNKPAPKTRKPTDTKPKPPIKKAAKKPTKQKINQRDQTEREAVINALKTLSKLGNPLLVGTALADLKDEETMSIPTEIGHNLVNLLMHLSSDILDKSGYTLEDLELI